MDPQNQPAPSNYQAQPAPAAPPPQAKVEIPMQKPSPLPQIKFKFPKKPLIGSIFVVVLLVAGYIFIKTMVPKTPVSPEVLAKQPGIGETQVTDTTGTDQKIPEGFPTNIPIEAQNLQQSYKIEYKDHGATQYTVAFTTSNSKEVIWQTYSDIMKAGGFALNATSTSQELGIMMGKRGSKEIAVSINEFGDRNLVTINYLERQ